MSSRSSEFDELKVFSFSDKIFGSDESILLEELLFHLNTDEHYDVTEAIKLFLPAYALADGKINREGFATLHHDMFSSYAIYFNEILSSLWI